MCSSMRDILHYCPHLYLSTTAPTQRKVFSTRYYRNSVEADTEIRDDVSIEEVAVSFSRSFSTNSLTAETGSRDDMSIQVTADSKVFRIGFDAIGGLCKELSHKYGQSLELREKARFDNGQFTVRQLKHGKDEPIRVAPGTAQI
jgi:hypothetical protein